MMSKILITFACGLYDRMLPLHTKEVQADGIDLNFLAIDNPREIFDRMSGAQEFDASEMSSSEFIARFAAGDCPFVATSLYRAFCQAKDLARQKMRHPGTLRYMLPWMGSEIEEIDEVFGGDPWPYGVEPNRATLEALVQYSAEQGLIATPIPVEKLFVPTFGLD